MLVIRRKPGEGISLNDGIIKFHIFAIEGDRVKIGIDAPADVTIVRDELLDEGTTVAPVLPPRKQEIHQPISKATFDVQHVITKHGFTKWNPTSAQHVVCTVTCPVCDGKATHVVIDQGYGGMVVQTRLQPCNHVIPRIPDHIKLTPWQEE